MRDKMFFTKICENCGQNEVKTQAFNYNGNYFWVCYRCEEIIEEEKAEEEAEEKAWKEKEKCQ
jgi:ribosome-binding protein aMBF1 (putative translation factor)